MSDTPSATRGYGKVGASIVAAWLSSYTMTQLSLHGVDFTELGVSSEIVKSTIIGILSGFFVWVSPQHLIQAITDAILFCRNAIKQWREALTSNKGT